MNVIGVIHDICREQRAIAHAWGRSDCLCFAAAVAMEIIGKDPIVHLRGRYDSEMGAKRIMVESGWANLGDVAASIFKEIPVSMAQSGDWVFLVNDNGTETIGVVVKAQIAARAEGGIGIVPLAYAKRAFRVE